MGRIAKSARRASEERAAVAAAAGGPPPVGAGGTADYAERVAKYIPAEIVALYLGILNLIQGSQVAGLSNLQGLVVAILAVLTPIYFLKLVPDPNATVPERRQHAVVASVAFVLWAWALGGPLFQGCGPVWELAAGIFILIFQFVVGFLPPKS